MIRPLLMLALLLAPVHARAGDLPGPIPAEVIGVTDGDTLEVRAEVWPDMDITVAVRIRGIDAPELHGDCESEREGADAAAEALARLIADTGVVLTAVAGDKYFGRVLADAATSEGEGIAAALLDQGLVRPYEGGRRQPWC
jgi:endonuclease YncB( thermonuclease family)